ncbi:MAG: hypothetical protein IIB38_01545 [Candidatus Hydrogenedentes bacterium]|nr:hypothetical protein [Candidatus Hydrogenedentota bacterium]
MLTYFAAIGIVFLVMGGWIAVRTWAQSKSKGLPCQDRLESCGFCALIDTCTLRDDGSL